MHPLEKLAIAIHAVIFLVCAIGLGWLFWSQIAWIPWWFSGPEVEFFFWRLLTLGLLFIALPISIFGPPIRRRLRARRREAGSR